MLEAVIFDFDGVIADTEQLHHRALVETIPSGLATPDWTAYREQYIGFDDRDAFRAIFRNNNLALSDAELLRLVSAKAILFADLADQLGALPYPGVLDLIREISRTFPLGLATGAVRSDIFPVLRRFKIETCFNVIVTAEDVAVSKPHPESYQKAFDQLKAMHPNRVTSPARCLAFEDTPHGVQSAKGAGLFVVGISNTHEPDQLHEADVVVEAFPDPEKMLAQMRSWF